MTWKKSMFTLKQQYSNTSPLTFNWLARKGTTSMTSDTHAAGPADQGEWLQTRPGERWLIRPERTAGKSFDCFRPGAPVADGHFETADHLQQGLAVRPVGRPIAGSSLVRRLVLAKDDPAKQRVRAWLSDINDERLFCLGLTSEDIAALRGTASPPAEATIAQGLDTQSEDSSASRISPPIEPQTAAFSLPTQRIA
jgi:hypothetical protein